MEKGEAVNIIGPNGKGKSTLTYLLYRFYAKHGGQILINGKDINCYQLSDIRRNIGIVTQKSGYLRGRFCDVVKLGCSCRKSEDELIGVLKSVKLYERVTQLPDGLYTYIDDFDREFSVGEIQRLQLVNVLLRDCQVVILDEATSHLDGETEELLYTFLKEKCKNRIVLNITHNRLMSGAHVRTYRMNGGKLERVENAKSMAKNN